jgi:hypothetical protein
MLEVFAVCRHVIVDAPTAARTSVGDWFLFKFHFRPDEKTVNASIFTVLPTNITVFQGGPNIAPTNCSAGLRGGS